MLLTSNLDVLVTVLTVFTDHFTPISEISVIFKSTFYRLGNGRTEEVCIPKNKFLGAELLSHRLDPLGWFVPPKMLC